MRSGEKDKDPNEHGLGSFPVLFTVQLPWITMWFSHSYSNSGQVWYMYIHLLFHTSAVCCRGSGTSGYLDQDTGPRHQTESEEFIIFIIIITRRDNIILTWNSMRGAAKRASRKMTLKLRKPLMK